ncbi:MAG: 1-acyl-sn-glycerol-3-phosphate acyltransferase [Chloroflexi bacterium]|nr:1-acyl-sn-glycerol-3-phosphate acyltransferase [Chloroflexota bacterium]
MADAPQSSAEDTRQRKRYYFTMTPLRRIITILARGVFLLIMDLHVAGLERFPRDGPVILAANHTNNYDGFAMQLISPRLIFFMAKAELHRNGFVDLVMRQLGSFPVERGMRDEWAMQHAREILKRGLVMGIFPEGSRNRGQGLRPAKTGAARLALDMNCPIVPLAVEGTMRMFGRFPRRTRVNVSVGEPVYPMRGETTLALTDRYMFALAEMLPPEQRGAYAQHPDGF